MTSRRSSVVYAALMAILGGGLAVADPVGCGPPLLSGGYGNAGFSAGYSSWIGGFGGRSCVVAVTRVSGGGSLCSGSVTSVVVPTIWYPCGFGCGPLYGGLLFSPYGTWLPAGYGPTFGPAGVFPFLNAFGANVPAAAGSRPPASQRIAAVASIDRRPALRGSNPEARARARKLVAVGDRHMRAALDAPGKLTAALDAYRRAVRIAPDLPEVYVRQAIACIALEREDAAARAIAMVAAIDPRLADDIDAHGRATLAEIWHQPDADRPDAVPKHWIAAHWERRWRPALGAIAAAPVEDAATAAR